MSFAESGRGNIQGRQMSGGNFFVEGNPWEYPELEQKYGTAELRFYLSSPNAPFTLMAVVLQVVRRGPF